jgi:hypothetical protein
MCEGRRHTLRSETYCFLDTLMNGMPPKAGLKSTLNAMTHSEHATIHYPPREEPCDRGFIHPPFIAHSNPALPSTTGGFLHLAPETRNAVYEKVFETPVAFFVVAAPGTAGQFRPHGKSVQSHYAAIRALQTLGATSREVRKEARTFFYASKHFLVLPYGYEYLLVFNRWLEAIGPRCRAVLRNVCFAGYLCLRSPAVPTKRFQELLRTCISVRVLTLQLDIDHLYAPYTTDLEAYIHQDQCDAPLPRVDVSQWAKIVMQMPKIEKIRLDIIRSADSRDDLEANAYFFDRSKNGKILAADVRRQLKEHINRMDAKKDIIVQVNYVGTDRRAYCASPW